MNQPVRRGDVFWANLDPTLGVEIQKTRPVIIVSNNVINQHSQLVIVVPLTTNIARLSPSHVLIPKGEGGLDQELAQLENRYGLLSSDLYHLYKAGEVEQSRDFIQWIGYYEVKLERESRYRDMMYSYLRPALASPNRTCLT